MRQRSRAWWTGTDIPVSPAPSPPSCPGLHSSALPCSLTQPAPGAPLREGDPEPSPGGGSHQPHSCQETAWKCSGGSRFHLGPLRGARHGHQRGGGMGSEAVWGPLRAHPHQPGGGVGPVLPGKGRLSCFLESAKQEEYSAAHTRPAPARTTLLRSPAGTWQGWAGPGQRWLGRALCLPRGIAGLGALRLPASAQCAPPPVGASAGVESRTPLLPGTEHGWATPFLALMSKSRW